MLNTVYQLVKPRQFAVSFREMSLKETDILVRPTHLSICRADQRYYQGLRAEKVLRDKLPMALIHEAIGEVVLDRTGQFPAGSRVVLLPNVPSEEDEFRAENYLPSSRFRGSTMDGFMQEYIAAEERQVLPLPDFVPDYTGAFTEMVSVCHHAITRMARIAHKGRDTFGVWGDGNMGFFTALLLKYRFPGSRVAVFGVSEEKLSVFTFADETYLVSDIPEGFKADHAFECVGGPASGTVINQIIDHIRPEGTIGILGVSEEPVPIRTRMVLELGLTILGTSRSGREDFADLLALYRAHPEIVDYLDRMVGPCIPVNGTADISHAFETDIHKAMGKTILIWNT